MVMKSKMELKEVFEGLSSLLVVKNGIKDFATVTPDFDMPVTVDSLSMSQDAPTLNHYKVHGLQADWAVTATPGDFTFKATVPTIHKDMVGYFFGESNTVATSTINGQQYQGISASLKSVKLNMGIILLSEDGSKAIIVKQMAVYATPKYENGSTTPFAFELTGSIEIQEGTLTEQTDDNIAFLSKKG